LRTLLVDNYDSFTYNLFQLLARVNGHLPHVIRNDDRRQWDDLSPDDFDGVVISPGPGRPERDRDFGISAAAIRDWPLPVLGICLGHQGLCHLYGGRVGYAPVPMHGRLSAVHHDGRELFEGIPSPLRAVRYHSLIIDEVPPELEVTARTGDGLVMAVRHRERPAWGVQFHPESIATEHGYRLLDNFRSLAGARRAATTARPAPPATSAPAAPQAAPASYRRHARELPSGASPAELLEALFPGARYRFWLDSSHLVPGLSRYSVIGAPGPLGELVRYDVARQRLTVEGPGGVRHHDEPVLGYLGRELARRRLEPSGSGFDLGYVGYLGYEVRADCGSPARYRSEEPDAAFMFVDRAVVFDHETGSVEALALSTPETADQTLDWLDSAKAIADNLAAVRRVQPPPPVPGAGRPVTRRHGTDRYRRLIDECLHEIREGESYEICLTNELRWSGRVDAWRLYQRLREVNPAPYAAFLDFADFAVLSCSPERFLRLDAAGAVESKPIKGTRRRGLTPQDDRALAGELRHAEKDLAENLMIVDLVRNDLGAVCEPGTVTVPELFAIESYATVHQLVSTVRGELSGSHTFLDCVRACFPPGSMTGAPKLRTMEIIDRLEAGPRGVYSGALGYLSLSGTADLSVVIRTMVVHPDRVTIGVGGAITALSDPDAEIVEADLKARALLDALALVAPPPEAAPPNGADGDQADHARSA
jgi:para-aminobenzoate synthetase